VNEQPTDVVGDAVAAQAHDPATSAGRLAWIAENRPDLRAAVAAHPAAYPDLLDWLARLGDAGVDAALARRGGGAPRAVPAWAVAGTAVRRGNAPTWRLPRWAVVVVAAVAGLAVLGLGAWVLVTQVLFPRGAESPEAAVTGLAAAVQEGDPVKTWLLLSPDEVGGLEDGVRDLGDRADALGLLGTGSAGAVRVTGLTTRTTTVSDDRARVDITGGTLTYTPGRSGQGVRARALAARVGADTDDAGEAKTTTVDLADVAGDLDGGLSVSVVKDGRRWFISPLLTVGALVGRAQGNAPREMSADQLARSASSPEAAVQQLLAALGRSDASAVAGALSEAEGLPVLENAQAVSDSQVAEDVTDIVPVGTSVARDGKRAVVTLDGISGVGRDGEKSSVTYGGGCVTSDGERECAPARYRVLLPAKLQVVTVREGDGRWGVSVVDSLGMALEHALDASDADLLRALDLQATAGPVATLDGAAAADLDLRSAAYATVAVRKGDGPLLLRTGLSDQAATLEVYRVVDGVPVPATEGVQPVDAGVLLLTPGRAEYRVVVLPVGDGTLPDRVRLTAAAVPAAELAVGQALTTQLAAGQSAVYDVSPGWLTGTVGAGQETAATATLWASDLSEAVNGLSSSTSALQVTASGAHLVLVAPASSAVAVDLRLSAAPPVGFPDASGVLQQATTVPLSTSRIYQVTAPVGVPVDISADPTGNDDVVLVVDGRSADAGSGGQSEAVTGAVSSTGTLAVRAYSYSGFWSSSAAGDVTLRVSVSAEEVGD